MIIKLGYARVSTDDKTQTLEQQLKALQNYGVEPDNCFAEKISGATNIQTGSQWNNLAAKATEHLEAGEQIEIAIVDWSRLSRDFMTFQNTIATYASKGVYWTVLNDARYTCWTLNPREQAADLLMLSIEAFGNQVHREKIAWATKAKLDYLKSQGVRLGRPTKLTDADRTTIKELYEQGNGAIRIAKQLTQMRLSEVRAELRENHYTQSEKERRFKHAKVSASLITKILKEI